MRSWRSGQAGLRSAIARTWSETRVERLIAVARTCLAAFSLLAISLDPAEPKRYAELAYALLAIYAAYSGLLLIWVERVDLVSARFARTTHAADLGFFILFQYFTQGAVSPFFVYFIFSLLCATLRWRLSGVLWTAPVALVAYLSLGLFADYVLHDRDFEMHRFIIRAAYLAVTAGLLAWLGAYQERRQTEISKLAEWHLRPAGEAATLVRRLLERAADILAAPRVLMAWTEAEEPWLWLASWAGGDFLLDRESPTTFEPLVAEPMAETDFFCSDLRLATPTVVHASSDGFRRWEGAPVHPGLLGRFSMGPVLSVRLDGQSVTGRLFVLDKHAMTADDLRAGQLVAQQMVASMDNFYLGLQLQRGALTEERIRLARDLHDGLLQSLTGMALQIEATRRTLGSEAVGAEARLREAQAAIVDAQRDVRFLIEELKPTALGVDTLTFDLNGRLTELVERFEALWRLPVSVALNIPAGAAIPSALGNQVYRIVHEALANVARHAKASKALVKLDYQPNELQLTVTDDGQGFPFQGVYDQTRLAQAGLGPASLMERVAKLRGTLVITSSATGACLDIGLPLLMENRDDAY